MINNLNRKINNEKGAFHGANKKIIRIIMAILILGGLIWIARPDSSQSDNVIVAKSNGTLIVQEASNYDFGTISMVAGNVTHQFKIQNTGSEAVTINKIYTSCMCTTAELMTAGNAFGPFGMPGHGAIPKIQGVVDPSEEATVAVVFDPAAHGPAGVGQIQRAITLENNAGEPIMLSFTATVKP